eukprot:3007566-Rhodomonas_salina.7
MKGLEKTVRLAIGLRASYAMSGTAIAHGGSRLRAWYAMPGTARAYGSIRVLARVYCPMSSAAPYAYAVLSGTDTPYHPTRVLCDVMYRHAVSSYAHAMRCAGHPRNQIQETAFLVQNVLRLRFLVFDFGCTERVYGATRRWGLANERSSRSVRTEIAYGARCP